MRILGIDYGQKRIGIAIADTDVNLAFARDAILAHPSVVEQICKLYNDEKCERAVVGYPLLESGEAGEQAQLTDTFANQLRAMGLEVVLYDERYTTNAALNNLAHLSPKERKNRLDSEAARLMLAEYLASLET